MTKEPSDDEIAAALRPIQKILGRTVRKAKEAASPDVERLADEAVRSFWVETRGYKPQLRTALLMLAMKGLLVRVLRYAVGTRPTHRRN